MALEVEKGTWTGNGSASQTISLASGSLVPQAIICWTVGPGAAGFNATANFTIGFGTRRGGATQSGSVGNFNADNVGTGNVGVVSNAVLLCVPANNNTLDYNVALSSFGTGQFAVTYTSGANASGDIFHYLVFGGSDITDANVVQWTMDSTGATEEITGVGFQPDVMFALDSGNMDFTGIFQDANALSFGFASSNSRFSSFAIAATDGDTMTSTMNWNRAYRTDACLERLTNNADTSDARWDLDSFNSDGCTLGVVDAPTSTTAISTFLFIKGGVWEAGSKAKGTGTGNDTFTLANAALTPRGVLLFTTRQTATGIGTGTLDFCVGAGTTANTTRGSAVNGVGGFTAPEAINTTSDRFHASDAVIEELTGGATPAETSEAWYDTASAGSFIIDWAVNGGSSALVSYLAFGDGVVAAATVPSRRKLRMFRGLGR